MSEKSGCWKSPARNSALTGWQAIRQGFAMSEEKHGDKNGDEHNHAENAPSETTEARSGGRFTAQLNPVLILLFMILAMLIVLAVTSLRQTKGAAETSDDPAVAAIKADLEARRSELNRQRIAMGLPPLEGASEPVEDIAKRLKADADTLAGISGRFQQMLADKDAAISVSNAETLRLERLRQDVSLENARLQSELQRALTDSAESERLKTMLLDAQSQRDALSLELADARQKLSEQAGGASADEFADLQRRYEETLRAKEFFEERVRQLENAAPKTELFADSVDELLPAAVELFRRLRKLEGMKDSDLTTEYSKLGVELGANVLHALDFATGSSELTEEDIRRLDLIISEEVPDGDLTLIIGYASETGNIDSNQKLSSARATAAAEYFAARKRPGQKVQAVYLGQTDRFSSRVPERNQICEVWRIRRK
jgi:outer membrane protein OmpA-like peptidoglycan-associated protein